MTAAESVFVPAAPVWELVARRQVQWGYSHDEMAAWLGLGGVVDTRAWMLRSTAERILRRLMCPAPASAGTVAAQRRSRIAEASLPAVPTKPEKLARIHAELAGKPVDGLTANQRREAS